jgi:hypothetical protein
MAVRSRGSWQSRLQKLDLIDTRTFGSRVIYERYGRARDQPD